MSALFPLLLLVAAFARELEHVELHWAVCEESARATLVKLRNAGYGAGEARERGVSYLDLPDLTYLDAGIVLRLRTSDGETTTTVKLRPLSVSRVRKRWFHREGFKCEGDRVGSRTVSSCSLDHEVSGDDEEFSRRQRMFLEEYASRAVRWEELRTFGPSRDTVWELEGGRKPFPDSMSLEAVRLPAGGPVFLELSTRVEAEDASRKYRAITAALRGDGFELCEEQKSKTRRVLEYFRARDRRN